MEKYNRDLHSKGLESYEVPQYDGEARNRLDLVFGFVAGAVLGSSLGLLLKPTLESKKAKAQHQDKVKTTKINDQDTTLRDEAKRKADALKEQARRVREDSERKRTALTNSEDPSSKELAAQRRAIQSEVEEHQSESQKSETCRKETAHFTSDHAPTAGISGQGLAKAAESSQSQNKAKDSKKVEDTRDAQKRAIRAEVDSDRLEGQTGPTSTAKAEGKDKHLNTEKASARTSTTSLGAQSQALEKDTKNNTTHKKSTEKVEKQPRKEVKFDKGVITHEKSNDVAQAKHDGKVSEEGKKTSSKVDKHTFDK
ncbi:hypothetical protein [Staphylococcus ratti]|uniref:YtxH domain-containing protein n=1 Tax=Staphylococcus ratti TaxID=2892440 RepID=A0ABY3PFG6_9STAP|nr:hypothetical protein [Staphylococcus ratti]UEX90943.1 hypothetical protein LN051_04820 [Staphylococcus ratti]